MKKKLFLAIVITTILCCLFAIGISAATTNEWGDVETVAGIDTSAMSTDTTALVVMFDGTEYHTYPANYVITSSSKLTVNYTPLNTALGSNVYASGSIIRLQIPNNVNNTGETMRGNSHGSALVEVDCSTAASEILIAHNAFHGCGKLVKANLSEKAYFASNNNYQFNGCSSLTSVTLPSDITFLPTNLFSGCSSLTSVDMNWENITVVNSNAFNSCSKLSMEVDLSNVTIVNEAGFYNCSLVTFKNANNLTYVGKNSFRGCPYITSVEFTSDLTGIGSYAFVSSGLTSVVFNGGNNFKVDTEAFNGLSNLEGEFNLTGCTTVSSKAFKDCSKLTGDLDLTSVTFVDQHAFYGCTGITNIKFGSAITQIKAEAFRGCTNLVFVDFAVGNNSFKFTDHRTFYDCTSLKAVSLPKGTTHLNNGTFAGCTNLEALYLGNSVIEINGNQGDNKSNGPTFANCEKMYFVNEPFTMLKADGTFYTEEEFKMPEKPTVYYFPSTLKRIVGSHNRNSSHAIDEYGNASNMSHDDLAFANCYNLNTYLVFPEGFTGWDDVSNSQNENYRGDTLGYGFMHYCATAENPVTLVFMGPIHRLSMDRRTGQTNYMTYMFANPANTGFENTIIGSGIMTDSRYDKYEKYEEMYVIFCHAEGGAKKYEIGFEPLDASTYPTTPVMTPTLVEATAENLNGAQNWHAYKPGTDYQSEATCTLPAGEFKLCFCGNVCYSDVVEGSEPLGHTDLNAIVEYYYKNNNYFDASYKKYTCTREGCGEVIDSQEGGIPALFIAKGMTVPDYGISALCHAIQINLDAVEDYNAFLGEGNEIKYGVLAGVAIDGNKPVGADGKSNCDAIVMGFEATKFSIIQLKLTGLEKANKQLYCGAYAVVDGTVSYLYEGTVSEYATPLIVNNGILDQTTPEATVEETKEN
ncbi:MAG: leucine-rich repeat domain-containing protein [Clostridia bacterium]|nr:leucine-rich repeat domain-containing protein [Clostridia bacterium]